MTAILLDGIVIAALSRAFDTNMNKLISSIHQDCGEDDSTLIREPNSMREESRPSPCSAVEKGNHESPERRDFSLSRGQLEIASILDAFAATYSAAYRYNCQLLTSSIMSYTHLLKFVLVSLKRLSHSIT